MAYLQTQSLTVARPKELTSARRWVFLAREELTRRGVKNPSDEMVAVLATEQRDSQRGRPGKRKIGPGQVRLVRQYDLLGVHSYDAYDTEAAPSITDRSVGPEQLAVATLMREQLLAKLADLPPNQSKAIDYRFGLTSGEPLTLDRIGVIMGKSKDTIKRWLNCGLAALRDKAGDFTSADLEWAEDVA